MKTASYLPRLDRRARRTAGVLAGVGLLGIGVALYARAFPDGRIRSVFPVPLVTGRHLSPEGTQTNAGSRPTNMILSPDGRFVLTSDCGLRADVSVLDAATGTRLSHVRFDAPLPGKGARHQGLYYGLACGPRNADGAMGTTTVYAARGVDNVVSVLSLDASGKLTDTGKTLATGDTTTAGETPNTEDTSGTAKVRGVGCVAGLALSRDGKTLFAADASMDSEYKGVLHVIPTDGTPNHDIPIDGYSLAAITVPTTSGDRVYVTSEQRDAVDAVDVQTGKVRRIPTGVQPDALCLDRARKRLFVANAGSDTISVIQTATDTVQQTLLLRPAEAHGLPGATPTGLALSPDEKTLYVTLADMNAVAVVDLAHAGTVLGYIPVGWYPTAVTVSADGKRLFVANAKGIAARTPNDKAVPVAAGGARPQYIEHILEGTVSTIRIADAMRTLTASTRETLANDQLLNQKQVMAAARATLPSGIRHVIYIIKENRTYDQVLGDLPQGNGDKSLVMFGRDVTPNEHALAEHFALLDNFYCCAEVSGDGWNWSTAGMASEYVQRNVPYSYTAHARPADYEGQNGNVPVDLIDIPDAARPPGGYIWDDCVRNHVTMRNYGFLCYDSGVTPELKRRAELQIATPTKKALLPVTAADFRGADGNYSDSDAWAVAQIPPFRRQVSAYGAHHDPARITAWKREFDAYVKNGDLPQFAMVRLPRDHTLGTQALAPSPRAMNADNDYAVGELVEAVSHSRYWKSTAIFVVEDDSQNGFDHVDCHRSLAFVISPFVRKSVHDSRFYNTDSVLHTMEMLLGLPPMTQYDAAAPVLDIFSQTPDNDAPYTAILPDRNILAETNPSRAYGAELSARWIDPLREDTMPDALFNDILWHAIKGNTPEPHTRRAFASEGAPVARHGDDD